MIFTRAPRRWMIGGERAICLDEPRLIAVVNATPDSFSDGGRYLEPARAVEHAQRAIGNGASILDVGAESTRPGAARVDSAQQIRRAIPVIDALAAAGIDAPVSIDTTRAEVARAAIESGATIINDVSAGQEDPRILDLAAAHRCGLILMHRLAPPDRDRYSTEYDQEPDYGEDGDGVVAAVRGFLRARADHAIDRGVDASSIVIDPGLGFGKSVAQNWTLVGRLHVLQGMGLAVLSAASRKSFVGAAARVEEPSDRDAASAMISVVHAMRGVRLFRVHDAAIHAQALAVARQMDAAGRLVGAE